MQLHATRRAAPAADLTLLVGWPWMVLAPNHRLATAPGTSDAEKKSEASTAASAGMPQLSVKAWRALN